MKKIKKPINEFYLNPMCHPECWWQLRVLNGIAELICSGCNKPSGPNVQVIVSVGAQPECECCKEKL